MLQKNLNKKLKLLFESLKIKKGDKIIIHSNIAGLLQFYGNSREDACKVFFSFLKKYLGKKGVIIILIKLFYLISAALFFILIPSRKNYIKASFLFQRASGRFIGLLNYKPKRYI